MRTHFVVVSMRKLIICCNNSISTDIQQPIIAAIEDKFLLALLYIYWNSNVHVRIL